MKIPIQITGFMAVAAAMITLPVNAGPVVDELGRTALSNSGDATELA